MRYYVNKNTDEKGDHEVHTFSCSHLPSESNRVYLGDFASCSPAVNEAKRHFARSNGCYWCSRSCHTS